MMLVDEIIEDHMWNEVLLAAFCSNIRVTEEEMFPADSMLEDHMWNEVLLAAFCSNIRVTEE
jgi:hypothetical protein